MDLEEIKRDWIKKDIVSTDVQKKDTKVGSGQMGGRNIVQRADPSSKKIEGVFKKSKPL